MKKMTILVAMLLVAGCGRDERAPAPVAAQPPKPIVTASDYDLQFLDAMRKHHEGAVTMAKLATERGSDAKVKEMAQTMIAKQQKEIDQLKSWRDQWFPNAPPADVSKVAGASSMNMDMSHMQSMQGHHLDMMFVDMMTPHHEGAIAMACEAHGKAGRNEVKRFSRDVIRDQEAEISRMESWKQSMKM
jgi:uncharacterized protein (DUF305 family)